MKVAIVILNYNTSSDCKKCISFVKQQRQVDSEIIVVDNNSITSDLVNLRNICTENSCTLIECTKNSGYSAGNNVGLKYASQKNYQYALIINPDVELTYSLFLFKVVSQMEADENIVVCGTDIILPNTSVHHNPLIELSFWDEFDWIGCQYRHRKQLPGTWWLGDYRHSGYCEKLHGCCFMIRISFLRSINFLDESTFLYSEEPILASQVKNMGKKLYYISDVQIIHNHKKATKGNPAKKWKILSKSRAYYLKKYSGYSKIPLYLILISRKIQDLAYNIHFKLRKYED